MNRRNALKNMGLLTGGLTFIPYSCSLTPELVFKRLANEHSIALMESNTAIQPIVLGCAEQTLAACEHLKQQGIWLSAIRPPTVQHNTSRLRVTLTAAHTQQDINTLITCLQEAIA